MNDLVAHAIRTLENRVGRPCRISIHKRWQHWRGDIAISFHAVIALDDYNIALGSGRTLEEAVECVWEHYQSDCQPHRPKESAANKTA